MPQPMAASMRGNNAILSVLLTGVIVVVSVVGFSRRQVEDNLQ